MPAVSNIFKITDLPDGKFAVSWPEYGKIYTHQYKELFIKFAFETGTYQAAFSNDIGNTYTVDTIMYYQNNCGDIAVDNVARTMDNITGIRVDRIDQAEKLVDSLEKHIMWKSLQRTNWS